jgi:hypothetical protein
MHDANLTLSGPMAKHFADEIETAANEMAFDVDSTTITNVEVHRHESETMTAPNGDEVVAPFTLHVFWWLDLPEGVDYAREGSAHGIETELHWFLTGELSELVKAQFDFDISLDRTQRCDHPEEMVKPVEVSSDYCEKCGGPAIDIA